jgi:hypothetical protein
MKKNLFFFLILFTISFSGFSQTSEDHVFQVASRIKVFLPSSDQANLEGEQRYIQLGMLGNENDIKDMIGYIDRYIVNGNDMISRIEGTISEEMIDYYKFYLTPLYDANDFQSMLEMFKINSFYLGRDEQPIKNFSNTIYASIKSKK